jgi:hypothetical protein
MAAQGKSTNSASPASEHPGTPQQNGSQSSAHQEVTGSRPQQVQTDVKPEERRRKVAEAAYYRAERRGFAPGSEDADWFEAESEIGRWLGSIDVETLNSCLRSELSAIETYEQALEKNRAHYAQNVNSERLTQILSEHREAAAKLRTIIQQQGGMPSSDSGTWGTWSQTVMGAAKLVGDKAALKALKEGEKSGLKEYQRVGQEAGASTENILSSFIQRQQAHIDDLDRLIGTA